MTKLWAIPAILLALTFVTPTPGLSQQAQPGDQTSNSSKPYKGTLPQGPRRSVPFPKPDPKEHNTMPLTSAPSLPDIPDYTGVKPRFEGGHYFPELHQGKCWAVSTLCRESPSQVYSWYVDALRARGWVLDPHGTYENHIVARIRDKGAYCTVNIGPAGEAPYQSAVSLREMIKGAPRITTAGN